MLTIKACCIMFDVKPIKNNDPNTPGKKIDDYWEAGLKGLLSDAKVFLNSLLTKLANSHYARAREAEGRSRPAKRHIEQAAI